MSADEIELKFSISKNDIPELIQHIEAISPLSHHILHLTNQYYDTADQQLKKNRSSLRVRTTEEQNQSPHYEMTIKSAGQSQLGLHQRSETNFPLSSAQLDYSLIPSYIIDNDDVFEQLKEQLSIQFETNFIREAWLIRFKETEIEIALDQGKVSSPSTEKTLPIQEVELEIKKGSTPDLIEFALSLSDLNIRLFSQSKAFRGYRVLSGEPLQLSIAPEHLNVHNLKQLPELLSLWQKAEEFAIEYQNSAEFDKVTGSVNSILKNNLNQFTVETQQAVQNWLNYSKTELPFESQLNRSTKLKLHMMLELQKQPALFQ